MGAPVRWSDDGTSSLLPMELTHYDLHVWLYKPNSLGTFAPTNPSVTCAGHPYRLVGGGPDAGGGAEAVV